MYDIGSDFNMSDDNMAHSESSLGSDRVVHKQKDRQIRNT